MMNLINRRMLLIAIFCFPAKLLMANCLPYEPSSVALEGIIQKKIFAGPPNYTSIKQGDKAEPCWVLKLAVPVCTKSDSKDLLNEAKTDIKNVQLVFDENGSKKYSRLLGQQVKVSGTLFAAQTGHHHTDVLLKVLKIE